ncbi:hypothetical protein EL22_08095 [Halostagnicola sp. A56]|uniref:DUF7331 family protein n=1 Tax=Halostagnicola sp. A56 TaxID=1495067 RepID=UPI0004A04127|nr:hypothetical protein [Halostagnicola sp. A56]KDE60610.1 hypothetical protein EL22_08095 [Halostagnicola sp. A56]
MIEVSTRGTDDMTADAPRSELTGTETIESYEIDDGVVFYDAENPLAWVETSRTLPLKEFV